MKRFLCLILTNYKFTFVRGFLGTWKLASNGYA